MAITPDEVDAAGVVSIDVDGRLVHVSPWVDVTYETRPIARDGRWYHAFASDNVTSYGLVHVSAGGTYAFEPVSVGEGLGVQVDSLAGGVRLLVGALRGG